MNLQNNQVSQTLQLSRKAGANIYIISAGNNDDLVQWKRRKQNCSLISVEVYEETAGKQVWLHASDIGWTHKLPAHDFYRNVRTPTKIKQ